MVESKSLDSKEKFRRKLNISLFTHHLETCRGTAPGGIENLVPVVLKCGGLDWAAHHHLARYQPQEGHHNTSSFVAKSNLDERARRSLEFFGAHSRSDDSRTTRFDSHILDRVCSLSL